MNRNCSRASRAEGPGETLFLQIVRERKATWRPPLGFELQVEHASQVEIQVELELGC